MIRIGFAKDIHQLEEGDYLLLGGIKIPSKNRIIAHSDGDVVLHAVSESLLGSLSLGDLGIYFLTSRYKLQTTLSFLQTAQLSVQTTVLFVETTVSFEEYVPTYGRICPELRNFSSYQTTIFEETICEIERINLILQPKI